MNDPADDFAATAPIVAPAIPPELWGLWIDDPAYDEGGLYVVSIDDAPGGQTYLVAFTEAEAIKAAEHQNESYDLTCRPVRIK